MPLSPNLNSYRDVQIILDAALKAGGAIYTLDSEGKAIHWVQRAYYYRKLLYNQKKEQFLDIPGLNPSTPYDTLRLKVEGKKVRIELIEPAGVLETLDGKPLTPEVPKDSSEDDLLAEAARLVETEGDDE